MLDDNKKAITWIFMSFNAIRTTELALTKIHRGIDNRYDCRLWPCSSE